MINVVVPDSVLLGDDDGFGWVEHYGPVPGDLLREWIAANAEQGVEQWVRRLYVTPTTGELVAMDSTARRFEGKLADYLRLRDRRCRTPYCDAPVRHLDHAEDHATVVRPAPANGQGVCEALQLRQAGPRLDRPTPARTTAHRRDHHADRTPLRQHRTGTDGGRARTADRAGRYVLTA